MIPCLTLTYSARHFTRLACDKLIDFNVTGMSYKRLLLHKKKNGLIFLEMTTHVRVWGACVCLCDTACACKSKAADMPRAMASSFSLNIDRDVGEFLRPMYLWFVGALSLQRCEFVCAPLPPMGIAARTRSFERALFHKSAPSTWPHTLIYPNVGVCGCLCVCGCLGRWGGKRCRCVKSMDSSMCGWWAPLWHSHEVWAPSWHSHEVRYCRAVRVEKRGANVGANRRRVLADYLWESKGVSRRNSVCLSATASREKNNEVTRMGEAVRRPTITLTPVSIPEVDSCLQQWAWPVQTSASRRHRVMRCR